ncbi:MAG: LamG domain-containing protein [Bacteroidales bacterium]|nr:LamG domain-containing protein [Bacteroidales bacterium]
MKKVTFLLLTLLFSLELIYAQNFALDFDGMNDYVEITQDASLNMYNSSFTVELWVKSSQTHNTEVILFEYGEWEIGTYQMTSDQQDQIKVNFHGRSSADGAELTGHNWTDGTWHHFAGVFNNSSNKLTLYMDGALLIEVNEYNAPGNATLSSYLGSRGGNTKFADMRMDELRIWDDVRSQSEIQNNMNIELTGSESNLVAYYNMNEGIGTSLMDHSSNSNNGTLENMDNSDWVADCPLSGTYSGGSGISGDPYQIATTADLIELSNTSADWSAYFIQTADIAFNADETQVDWNNSGSAGPTDGFSPIGNSTNNFSGSYNGSGYTIDNLFINRSSTDNIGLFGMIGDNVAINDLAVTNADITGKQYSSILCGRVDGSNSSIDNCETSGTLTGSVSCGSMVGRGNGSISNSHSSATVSAGISSDWSDTGGLIGDAKGTISNCYVTGNVTAEGRNTGGLAGWVREGITIEQCFTTGDVTINSSNPTGEAGGLVGSYSGTSQIINSYATGTISVDNSGNGGVGGLVGQLTDNPSIENCYFSGEVINTSGNIGGLIGEFEFSSDAPTLTNNLWNNSINSSINGIGNDSDNGVTGLTTAQMQDVTTFTNTSTTGLTSAWDFVNDPNDDGASNDYWDISSSINDGYPYLTKENSDDPLPVNLLSFTGERKAKSIVELHWSTAS